MSSINPFIGSLQLANQIKYNYYRSEGSFLYFCNIYVTTNYDKKTFYWQAELFQWCFVFEFRTFQIFLWWQHISWPSAKSQYFLLQRLFISPAELSCISLHWSSGDCSLGFINFNIETVLNTHYPNKVLMVLSPFEKLSIIIIFCDFKLSIIINFLWFFLETCFLCFWEESNENKSLYILFPKRPVFSIRHQNKLVLPLISKHP